MKWQSKQYITINKKWHVLQLKIKKKNINNNNKEVAMMRGKSPSFFSKKSCCRISWRKFNKLWEKKKKRKVYFYIGWSFAIFTLHYNLNTKSNTEMYTFLEIFYNLITYYFILWIAIIHTRSKFCFFPRNILCGSLTLH